jgi:hypothetical protein
MNLHSTSFPPIIWTREVSRNISSGVTVVIAHHVERNGFGGRFYGVWLVVRVVTYSRSERGLATYLQSLNQDLWLEPCGHWLTLPLPCWPSP